MISSVQRLAARLDAAILAWFTVAGLTLIGLMLRLPGLGVGLWRDEAATFFNSQPGTLAGLIQQVRLAELNPPVFHLIMHHWVQLAGDTDILIKVPALVFGLLLIPASYQLARSAHSRTAGVIAATLIAFSPQAIYYSQEARAYSLTALLCVLTTLAFLQALVHPRRYGYLLGFVLGATLLLYTQYTGLLLVGGLFVMALVVIWKGLAEVRVPSLALAFLAIGALFLPWLPVFLTHLAAGNAWDSVPPIAGRPMLLLESIQYSIPFSEDRWTGIAALAVAAAALVGAVRLIGRGPTLGAVAVAQPGVRTALVGGTFFVSIAAMAALSHGGRYVFPFLPLAFALYAAWLVQWGRCARQGPSWCQAAVILLALDWFLLPGIDQARSFGEGPKSALQTLAADWRDEPRPNTAFLIAPDRLGPSFGYYFRDQDVPYFGFGRWEHPEIFVPQGYAVLWNDPNLLDDTLKRIAKLATQGYTHLALVRDDDIGDSGSVRRGSLTKGLQAEIKRRYRRVEQKRYAGTIESVTLQIYDLRTQRSP